MKYDDDNPVVPPQAVATPADVAPAQDGPLQWWRPGWQDCARYIGYRWIYLLPAVPCIIVLVHWWALGRPHPIVLILGIKLSLVVVAITLSLAGFVIRRAVRARTEPFCIYCGYNLTSLPDHYRCPECGRPYTFALIHEYRRDPQWFIERYNASKQLPQADEAFAAGPIKRRRRAKDGTE